MLLGAHHKNKLDNGVVEIKKWITHKDAKQLSGDLPQGKWLKEFGGVDTDISILVLSKKVQLNNKIQPACLPSSPKQSKFEESSNLPFKYEELLFCILSLSILVN